MKYDQSLLGRTVNCLGVQRKVKKGFREDVRGMTHLEFAADAEKMDFDITAKLMGKVCDVGKEFLS